MIEVVSLLGVSYSGKSTLAAELVTTLAPYGIEADMIKKDEAMRALGRERYGEDDQTGGYSAVGTLLHGRTPPSELHAYMNEKVRASLEAGHLPILEGGTRTRSAQAETLAGIKLSDDGLHIFMMQLPLREVWRRSKLPRDGSDRYDDKKYIAPFKLLGQYRGMRSEDAPRIDDRDVTLLDAMLPTAEQARFVTGVVLRSRGS